MFQKIPEYFLVQIVPIFRLGIHFYLQRFNAIECYFKNSWYLQIFHVNYRNARMHVNYTYVDYLFACFGTMSDTESIHRISIILISDKVKVVSRWASNNNCYQSLQSVWLFIKLKFSIVHVDCLFGHSVPNYIFRKRFSLEWNM